MLLVVVLLGGATHSLAAEPTLAEKVASYCQPPAEYAGQLGTFRSPLKFYNGDMVKSPADWERRRAEIRARWFDLLGGPWPALLEKPQIKRLESEIRQGAKGESIVQHSVRVDIAVGKEAEGYLLLPPGPGPFPAVLVPFYEAQSSVGLKEAAKGSHDFAWQLAERGFVTLAIGTPGSVEHPGLDTRPLLVLAGEESKLQPLSYLAYVAANCHRALAALPEVDPQRIGITGHSYGGKWSMFASCLYDGFACAVWGDPGIYFDEANRNVNYYEPWYIGYEPGKSRKPGVPSAENPRTGLYKQLFESGEPDLLEFESLICPRPVLISGGSEDPPKRWPQVNQLIAINDVLGVKHRVGMTNRDGHKPTPEAVAALHAFFDYHLQPGNVPKNASSGNSAPAWKAGVAQVKITPETSLPMAGYAARKKPSEGVAQDLFAKALAIEDAAGTRLVIVTLDLIGVPRVLRERLEKTVAERFKLPRSGLLLNASHTHCGPSLRFTPLAGDAAAVEAQQPAVAYAQQLETKLVALIGESLQNLAPAQLDYLHARCGFAMNRRRPTDTVPRNSPHSGGPVDHNVPVLRVADQAGQIKGLLFSYACHNTTLSFYQFCGDYAGYAQEYLQAEMPQAVALFMTGCGGDQNPYPRGKIELAQQHGRALANSVLAALDTVPVPVPGPLRTAYDEVTLNFAPPPNREQLLQLVAEKKEPQASHAQRLLKQLAESGTIRDTYSYPVQVIDWGNNLLTVALGGEVVVDYSLRLQRELTGHRVWVAGYSNDVFGYVPSQRVLQEGGYEAGGAMLYGSLPGPFAPDVEERIIGKVLELAKSVSAKGR